MTINHKKVLKYGLSLSWIILVGIQPVYAGEDSSVKAGHKQSLRTTVQDKTTASTNKKTQKKKSPIQAIIDQFSKLLKRVPEPATTRGYVCPIAPGILENENKIYSDLPVFIWHGSVDEIELKNYESGKRIWSAKIPEGKQFWKYTGTPLQAGKEYIWELRYQGLPQSKKVFELMSEAERDIFKQQEDSYSQSLSEEQSLTRANLFSDHKLWSDKLVVISEGVSSSHNHMIDDLITSWARKQCQGNIG